MRIKSPLSADEFHTLTRPLIGLPISRPWRGFGSALILELGALTHVYPRTVHPRAEAGIMIEWSWRVERRSSIQFGSWSTERKINLGIPRLQARAVEEVSLVGRLPEISVRLSGALWLHSFMTAGGQPDWTLFLPDSTWLTARRGCVVHEQSDRPNATPAA